MKTSRLVLDVVVLVMGALLVGCGGIGEVGGTGGNARARAGGTEQMYVVQFGAYEIYKPRWEEVWKDDSPKIFAGIGGWASCFGDGTVPEGLKNTTAIAKAFKGTFTHNPSKNYDNKNLTEEGVCIAVRQDDVLDQQLAHKKISFAKGSDGSVTEGSITLDLGTLFTNFEVIIRAVTLQTPAGMKPECDSARHLGNVWEKKDVDCGACGQYECVDLNSDKKDDPNYGFACMPNDDHDCDGECKYDSGKWECGDKEPPAAPEAAEPAAAASGAGCSQPCPDGYTCNVREHICKSLGNLHECNDYDKVSGQCPNGEKCKKVVSPHSSADTFPAGDLNRTFTYGKCVTACSTPNQILRDGTCGGCGYRKCIQITGGYKTECSRDPTEAEKCPTDETCLENTSGLWECTPGEKPAAAPAEQSCGKRCPRGKKCGKYTETCITYSGHDSECGWVGDTCTTSGGDAGKCVSDTWEDDNWPDEDLNHVVEYFKCEKTAAEKPAGCTTNGSFVEDLSCPACKTAKCVQGNPWTTVCLTKAQCIEAGLLQGAPSSAGSSSPATSSSTTGSGSAPAENSSCVTGGNGADRYYASNGILYECWRIEEDVYAAVWRDGGWQRWNRSPVNPAKCTGWLSNSKGNSKVWEYCRPGEATAASNGDFLPVDSTASVDVAGGCALNSTPPARAPSVLLLLLAGLLVSRRRF